jgi:hypothetical protein
MRWRAIKQNKVKELETEYVVKIDCNRYCAAVTDDGALFIWGTSILGQFEKPEKIKWIPKSVVYISIGTDVAGWIDSSGLIWAWGKNENGELGVGDCSKKETPYPVMALKTKRVTSLSWGGSFYVAIGSTITLKSPLENKISQSKDLIINIGWSSLKPVLLNTQNIVSPNPISRTISTNNFKDTMDPFKNASLPTYSSVKSKNQKIKVKAQEVKAKKVSRNARKAKKYITQQINEQRMVTVNDCQIQTVSDAKSETSLEYSKDLEGLYRRLAVIEEVLVERDTEILKLKKDSKDCTIDSSLQIDMSEYPIHIEKAEMSIQASLPIEDTSFTKEEIDELLHKLKSAHDEIAQKDAIIQNQESHILHLQEEIDSLKQAVDEQNLVQDSQRELNEKKLHLQKEQQIVIEELNSKLLESEDENRQLAEQYDQLAQEFEEFMEVKEQEIVGLKIDIDTMQTEYEEWRKEWEGNGKSTRELKRWLDRIKSDYKLLQLENTTLQEMIEKEKQSNRQFQSQSFERNEHMERKGHSVNAFSRSQVTPQMPLRGQRYLFDTETTEEPKYFSVRRSSRKTETSLQNPYVEEEDVYQLNSRNNKEDDKNYTSQSPILPHGIHNSESSNRGSKFSLNSIVPWAKVPF